MWLTQIGREQWYVVAEYILNILWTQLRSQLGSWLLEWTTSEDL